MPNQAKKTLEANNFSCCGQDPKNIFPMLVEMATHQTSNCSCCEPTEESNDQNNLPFIMIKSPSSPGCDDNSCGAEDRELDIKEGISGHIFEFRVEGMDCPVCAQTLEKILIKIPGVNHAKVNYSSSKMQVVADDESLLESIQKHAQKLGFTTTPFTQTKKKGQTFNIAGMDCGVCAETLEKYLKTLPAVREASVNFSTGKLKIVHDMTIEEVMNAVSKSGYKASLVSSSKERNLNTPVTAAKKFNVSSNSISGILLALGYFGTLAQVPELISTLFYAAAVAIGGYKPAKSAYYAVRSKSLDMNVLMTTAAIGAAIIGQWLEAATVVWLFSLGIYLQTRTLDKTRNSIRSLMSLTPPEAWLKIGQDLIRTSVDDISVGDTIVIKPGEKIPLDGEIVSGISSINQAAITGESVPSDKSEGDTVYAGTINENGSLEVKVTKLIEDTTIAKIIHLVEEAQGKKGETQAIVDRFAKIYTPIVFLLAILTILVPPLLGLGTWSAWFYKGLELLVIACPCALVISTPVAIVSAIGNAAKNGVLIKGGTFLEVAGTIRAIAFDKTGTLTAGKPKVVKILPIKGSELEIISVARTIEEHSQHPIALAILDYARANNISSQNADSFKAIVGKGAQASIEGTEYFAGKPELFRELGLSLDREVRNSIETSQNEGNSIVMVGTKAKLLGIILVADFVRDVTVTALKKLKEVGIVQAVMLTGDNEGTARKVASETGVDQYFSELLPEDKLNTVKQLQQEYKVVAMVGDGINDAPALATANLGIAMGGAGTDTAMETADIVLMADNLEKLPHTIKLSRQALSIIKQNIWFAILVKLVALVLIFPGWLTLWMAVMSDTGAALLVIFNSMRLMRMKDC
ncbi:heavy metal translocating P-type ATPase [Desulfosporosinus meridiei]|uniref:Cd(2+)-exporting ATPase n=1 Tax=Desulfosporosinus meridiei (strain ATCC BAA-275 / DSM 13257 / KCTC 12902 / NCIMB 13706 / S10) TaxID=768704 RepID=J7IVT0_DESMD|nr:heavy metal translocating P-type ATPase [Desulfosporosinus meridiei]AFQ44264.1 copper/silver-translocating P-type ATPase,heavy metal-translocating P-type ATPase, Cd/Co/Hg/Pb/Zn-transporting [Desulfosporosinus meridiei DSM 13257]